MFVPPYPYIPKAASDETIKSFDRDMRIAKCVLIGLLLFVLFVAAATVLLFGAR